MRPVGIVVVLIMTVFSLRPALAADASAETAYEPMKIFESLAGKTWRGAGTAPDGKPIVDVAYYAFILGGRALQATHKLEGGTYGGRTIFFYDEAAKEYVFHYFTTAGFHTIGAVTPVEGGFRSVERVSGHPDVAEVRSDVTIEGRTMKVVTRHVDKHGEERRGDVRVYELAGGADAFEGFGAPALQGNAE